MLYGYACVITAAQDFPNQTAQLKAADRAKVYAEKISGATADRPQLKRMLQALNPADVVIVPAVDRLSRDATNLLVIAPDIQKVGPGLRSVAEPIVDTIIDFAELVPAMLGVAAKLERPRIIECTDRPGRCQGPRVRFGRNLKLTPHQHREAIKRRKVGKRDATLVG